MRIQVVSIVLSLVLALGACSVPKDVVYFQGIDSLSPERVEEMSQPYVSRICQGEVSAVSSAQLRTYLVDAEGYINFPVLGRIHVAGQTKQELSTKMQQMIEPYVKDALVNIQIVNYKVTVMGEVARPGAISVKNDRISILDAIGQVGDLTINANRTNILVIRDNNGAKEFGRLDITEPDIFTSPYYYLQQNDVVYVEPNNAKKRNARYSQAQQYSITVFSSILSAISVVTTVILAITK